MAKQIRVIQLVENLYVGGLEKIVALVSTLLDKKTYKVEVWCLADGGPIAESLVYSGVKVKKLSLNTYHNPKNVMSLISKIKEHRPHVIHSHGYYASTFKGLACAWINVPCKFTHVHTEYHNFKRRHILMEKLLSNFTDKIICVSKSVQNFVIAHQGIEPQKTCVIHNSAGSPNIHKCPPAHNPVQLKAQGHHENIIVAVGSLVENKGQKILIDAMHMLLKEGLSLKLILIGDGPMRGFLEEYVKKLNLTSYVKLTGQLSDPLQIIDQADLFIMPSVYREGLPLALLEAMSCGTAVVASKIGGIPEAVHENENGILVPPADPYSLKRAIKFLIQNPVERKKMGERGRSLYQELFSCKKMIQSVEMLYEKHLQKNGYS